MTKYYNSFRGQTVGASVTAVNSATSGAAITPRYASSDPLSLVYDDVHVLQQGYRSVRTGTGTDLAYLRLTFTAGDDSMSSTARCAIYFPTDFQFNPANVNLMQMQYNAGANAGALYLLTNGQLQFNTMTAGAIWQSAAPIVLGHWYTFELFTVVGITAYDGTIDFQYFLDGSQVPAEPPYRNHVAKTNVSATGVNSFSCGKLSTSTVPQVMWVGPMYVNSRATGLEGAFAPPAWSQWSGTAELPLSFRPVNVLTNLATNPGYEVGGNSIMTGSSGTYVISTDTLSPIAGTKSAMFTRAGTLSSTIAQILCSTAGSKIPVTVGQPITGGLSIKTDVPNARIWTRWYWYDASVALTTGPNTDRVLNAVAGQVYRVADTGIPPAGTVTAWLVVFVSTATGNAVAGQRVWADQLVILDGNSGDGAYFDGDTADTATMRYDWTGTANASTSTATPVTLTNQATNPAAENGVTCFNTNDGTKYTAASDSVNPIAGTKSVCYTRTANTPGTALGSFYLSPTPGVKFVVTPGVPFTLALSIRTDVEGVTLSLNTYFYDSANTRLLTTPIISVFNTVAGQVYRLSQTNIPPANAVGAWGNGTTVMAAGTGNAPTGGRTWVDLLLAVNGATDGAYFDGNTVSDAATRFAWTGAVNASTSTATAFPGVWDGAALLPLQTTIGMI